MPETTLPHPPSNPYPYLLGEGGMSRVYRTSETKATKIIPIMNRPLPGARTEMGELYASPEGFYWNEELLTFQNKKELSRLQAAVREYSLLEELEEKRIKCIVRAESLYFTMVKGYLQANIVLGFIEGRETSTITKEDDSLPEVAKILADTSSTLEALASLGIVHRDIKPGNLMYTADGSPGKGITTLIDFGIAERSQEEEEDLPLPLGSICTQSSLFHREAGTSFYFSPERLKEDQRGDYRTDWFALGLTAYKLLMGSSAPLSPDYHLLLKQPSRFQAWTNFHFQRLTKYDNFQRDVLMGILWQDGCPKGLAEAIGLCLDVVPERRDIQPLIREAKKVAGIGPQGEGYF